MPRSRLAIASLGGTITMTNDSNNAGLSPSLKVEDLIDQMSNLAGAYDLITETLGTVPGASLEFRNVLEVFEWAETAVGRGAIGVVVVQGTDTIEETAYLLDLLWSHDEPLVVTGAMRSPQHPGADGPANLLGSVLTALSPKSRGMGVLVVMNDEVHAARRVSKSDSISTSAFQSPPFGPLGRIHEQSITYGGRIGRHQALPLPGRGIDSSVFIWETFFGDDGRILRSIDSSLYDGVVISGFGAGHVSYGLAEVVSMLACFVPVVLTSRAGVSIVLKSTYGFVGSEKDLISRGAIPAGWLTPLKARLLLCVLVALDLSPEAIRSTIMTRGDLPGGIDVGKSM